MHSPSDDTVIIGSDLYICHSDEWQDSATDSSGDEYEPSEEIEEYENPILSLSCHGARPHGRSLPTCITSPQLASSSDDNASEVDVDDLVAFIQIPNEP